MVSLITPLTFDIKKDLIARSDADFVLHLTNVLAPVMPGDILQDQTELVNDDAMMLVMFQILSLNEKHKDLLMLLFTTSVQDLRPQTST